MNRRTISPGPGAMRGPTAPVVAVLLVNLADRRREARLERVDSRAEQRRHDAVSGDAIPLPRG